jgi:hypothetical protein
LEIGFPLDVEKVPSEIMQLEHGEDVRLISDGLLDVLGVLIKTGSRPGMIFAMMEKP